MSFESKLKNNNALFGDDEDEKDKKKSFAEKLNANRDLFPRIPTEQDITAPVNQTGLSGIDRVRGISPSPASVSPATAKGTSATVDAGSGKIAGERTSARKEAASAPKVGSVKISDYDNKFGTPKFTGISEADRKREADAAQKLASASADVERANEYQAGTARRAEEVNRYLETLDSADKDYNRYAGTAENLYGAYQTGEGKREEAGKAYSSALEEYRSATENIAGKLGNVRSDTGAIDADIAEWNDRKTANTRTRSDLESRRNALSASLSQIASRKTTDPERMKNEIAQINGQIDSINKQIGRIDAENAEIDRRIGSFALEKQYSISNRVKEYESVSSLPDYAKKSQYRSTANGQEHRVYGITGVVYDNIGYDDALYDAINGDETARARLNLKDISTNTAKTSRYFSMTKKQIGVFNYLYADNPDEAYRYADMVTSPVYSGIETGILGFLNGIGSVSIAAAAGKAIGSVSGNEEISKRAEEVFKDFAQYSSGARQQNPAMYTVGSVAGSLTQKAIIGKGIGAVAGAKMAALVSPEIARIASSAATFALSSAIDDAGYAASGMIGGEDYAKRILVSGAQGLAGAVASGLAGSGIGTVLARNKLMTPFFEYVRQVSMGMASAGANIAVGYALSNEKPDGRQLAEQFATAFLLSLITGITSTAEHTEAAKARAQQMETELALVYSEINNEARSMTVGEREKLASRAIELTNNLRDYFGNTYFAGQQEEINNILDALDAINARLGLYTGHIAGGQSGGGNTVPDMIPGTGTVDVSPDANALVPLFTYDPNINAPEVLVYPEPESVIPSAGANAYAPESVPAQSAPATTAKTPRKLRTKNQTSEETEPAVPAQEQEPEAPMATAEEAPAEQSAEPKPLELPKVPEATAEATETAPQTQTAPKRNTPAQTARAEQAKAKLARTEAVRGVEKVRSDGFLGERGTSEKSIAVIPLSARDSEITRVSASVEAATGLDVVPVVGRIDTVDGRTRSEIGSVAALIRADDPYVTVSQLGDRVIYISKTSEETDRAAIEAIVDKFGEDAYNGVVATYAAKQGTGLSDNPFTDESEDAIAKINRAVLADAYAGINEYGAKANRFTDIVRDVFGKDTGITEHNYQIYQNGRTEKNEAGEKESTGDGTGVLRGSGKRNDGAGDAEPSSELEKSSGSGIEESGRGGSGGVRESGDGSSEKRMSPYELGLPNGSKKQKVEIVSAEYSDDTRKTQRLADRDGISVVYFSGDGLIVRFANGTIRARGANYVDENGKTVFLVRADDPVNGAYQIYLHERAHAYVRARKINTKDIYSRMVREIGEENVAAMIREYAKAVYGTENLADLSLGDFNEAVDYVFTEIVCDALAGMNAFRKLPEMQELGGAFLETVLGETKKSMVAGTRAPPKSEASYSGEMISPEESAEYMDAAEGGDTERARELVEKAAEKWGAIIGEDGKPLKLYHGTGSFGFTEFDLGKMDDKKSIFLTDDPEVASTYAGSAEIRKTSDVDRIIPDDPESVAQILNVSDPEAVYSVVTVDELKKIKESVVKRLEGVSDLAGKELSGIDSRSDGSLENHSAWLETLNNRVKNALYYDKFSRITDSFKKEDVFKFGDDRISYGEDEARSDILRRIGVDDALVSDVSLIENVQKRLRELRKNSGGKYITRKPKGSPDVGILSEADVEEAKKNAESRGIYSLYAKTENPLEINCGGANWNRVPFSPKITVDETEIRKDGKTYRLYFKKSGKEIPEGELPAVNGNYPVEMLHNVSVNKVNSINGMNNGVMTTRDVVKYAYNNGYNSVIFRDIRDNGGKNDAAAKDKTSNVYVVFDSSFVRSSDPVTYDDSGDIIPLEKRFSSSRDIRYSGEQTEDEDLPFYFDETEETEPSLTTDAPGLEVIPESERKEPPKLTTDAPGLEVMPAVDRNGNEIMNGFGTDPDFRRSEHVFRGGPNDTESNYSRYGAMDAAQETTKEIRKRTPKEPKPRKPRARKVRGETAAAPKSIPSISKRDLRRELIAEYSIPEGSRASAGKIIDRFADRVLSEGRIAITDAEDLFDKLYRSGMVTVPADPYSRTARQMLYHGHVYVDETTKAEWPDKESWKAFRNRAFAAGIYLTNDRANGTPIDSWNVELADLLPGLFDADDADMRGILERIVDAAEEGRDSNMTFQEYVQMMAEESFKTEREITEEMKMQLISRLEQFADKAGIEMFVKNRVGQQLAEQRAIFNEEWRKDQERQVKREKQRQLERERARQNKALTEMRQKTLKALQWLNRNRNKAPADLRAQIDDVLADIDVFAATAGKETNWSKKYDATWGDLVKIYQDLSGSENFFPSEEMKRIAERLGGKKTVSELTIDDLNDLYRLAQGIRTEYYNRNNVIQSETGMLFSEAYDDVTGDLIKYSDTGKTLSGIGKLFGSGIGEKAKLHLALDMMTPINIFEMLGGWNPDSAIMQFGRQLEEGERMYKRIIVEASLRLQGFEEQHREWLKTADGQGEHGVWYKVTIPALVRFDEFGQGIASGGTVDVYMTPIQKVQLYLESKNQQNLLHIARGGRKFPEMGAYSRGDYSKAFSNGRRYQMLPSTVKMIVSDLTKEEKALADILDEWYNNYAPSVINPVSNILYGYDKAGTNGTYAPIVTDSAFVGTQLGIYDATAEGVGSMKERIKFASNPSLNIGAIQAFKRNVDQMARFVGYSIPVRNWTTLINMRTSNGSFKEIFNSTWYGGEALNYLNDYVTALQGGRKSAGANSVIDAAFSRHVGAVFAANPKIMLNQFLSYPVAAAVLGFDTLPIGSFRVDRSLISVYTPELDYRLIGYATPELAALTQSTSKIQSVIRDNKVLNVMFGGGQINWADGVTVAHIWPWAENYVRKYYPDLEVGSEEDVRSGKSEFYMKVADVFNRTVTLTQPMYDETHRALIMKTGGSLGAGGRAVTAFKSVPVQQYNAMVAEVGESWYYKSVEEEARERLEKEQSEANRAALEYASAKRKHSDKLARASFIGVIAAAIAVAAVGMANAVLTDRDKKYRDEEGNLSVEAIIGGIASDTVANILGSIPVAGFVLEGVSALFGGGGSFGDRLLEMPGIQQINDVYKQLQESIGVIGNFASGENRNINKLLGAIKDIGGLIAMYGLSLPTQNVEKYLLAVVNIFAPGVYRAYNNLFDEVKKNDLKTAKSIGDAQTIVGDLFDQRGIDVGRKTTDKLASLYYDAGRAAAVPAAVPDSFKIEGEDYTLTPNDKDVYSEKWNEVVERYLPSLVGSKWFDYSTTDMGKSGAALAANAVDKLYSYADALAKSAISGDYEADKWASDLEAAAEEFGIDPVDYVIVKADADRFARETTDDGIRLSASEQIKRSIDTYNAQTFGTPVVNDGEGVLNDDEKAIIWQIASGSSSGDSNPYDQEIGWEYLYSTSDPTGKLTSEQRDRYETIIGNVAKSEIWSAADDKAKYKAENLIADIIAGKTSAKTAIGIINGGDGITAEMYVLYTIALAQVDEPSKTGKLGSYTTAEKTKAAELVGMSTKQIEKIVS